MQPLGASAGVLPVAPGKPPIYYYTVPFAPTPLHGAPLVQLQFDKEHSANFVLDTGIYFCILRPKVADAFGLVRKPLPSSLAPLRSLASDIECVTVDHMEIGNYIPTSGMFFVTDKVVNAFDKSVAGVLTGDIFLQAAVLLDFEKQTISEIPGGELTDVQLITLGFADGSAGAIDMVPTDNSNVPRFFVRGRVTGGQHTKLEGIFLLDTGNARTSFMGNPTKLHVTPFTKSKMLTFGGTITSSVGHVESIEIEPHNPASPPARLSLTTCNFERPAGERTESNLGMDFLSHFRVLIDYPAHKLYLLPIAHDSKTLYPTETARVCAERMISDAIFKPSATGEWTVLSIAVGGGFFAAKGLRAGDILTTIEDKTKGKVADGLQPDELEAQIGNNIDTLKLTVVRDGKQIKL